MISTSPDTSMDPAKPNLNLNELDDDAQIQDATITTTQQVALGGNQFVQSKVRRRMKLVPNLQIDIPIVEEEFDDQDGILRTPQNEEDRKQYEKLFDKSSIKLVSSRNLQNKE